MVRCPMKHCLLLFSVFLVLLFVGCESGTETVRKICANYSLTEMRLELSQSGKTATWRTADISTKYVNFFFVNSLWVEAKLRDMSVTVMLPPCGMEEGKHYISGDCAEIDIYITGYGINGNFAFADIFHGSVNVLCKTDKIIEADIELTVQDYYTDEIIISGYFRAEMPTD